MASAMTRGAAKHATNTGVCALVVCVIAALCSQAAADERPVLVIDTTGTDDGRAMVSRIERHIGPDPLLGPVPDRFRTTLAQPTATDTSWKAEETTLAEARKLLTPIGYRQAAEKARKAQDKLAPFAGEPDARVLLAELVLVEGLAVAGERGLDAARPLFLLVHRLTPGRTLDPGRYLPEVVKAFAAASVTGATGRVSINAVGATEVLIDGVVAGGEPLENQAVPEGPHIITVRGERVVTSGRRIEAVAADTVTVPFVLLEAPLAVRMVRARDRLVDASDDGSRNIAIRDLLGAMKTVSHAILVVREGGDAGPIAVRLFTDQGGLGPPRPVGDDVAGAIAPLRPLKKPPPRGGGNDGTGKPGSGLGPGPELPPETPWYRQSWFKATGGTVAGVAAVVLITAIVTRDPGTSTLDPGVDVER